MTNNGGKEVEATTVTNDDNYAYVTIPSGYYDEKSKIKIQNGKIAIKIKGGLTSEKSQTIYLTNIKGYETFDVNNFVITVNYLCCAPDSNIHTDAGTMEKSLDKNSRKTYIRTIAYPMVWNYRKGITYIC